MNIDEMQAGPGLDQLIGKEVMAWTVKEYDHDHPRTWLDERGYLTGWTLDEGAVASEASLPHGVFRPSVDWGAAGVVFDKMPEHNYYLSLHNGRGYNDSVTQWKRDGFSISVWHPNGKSTVFDAEGETAPLAICRAVLKAVLGIDKT